MIVCFLFFILLNLIATRGRFAQQSTRTLNVKLLVLFPFKFITERLILRRFLLLLRHRLQR